ncbi:MAG: hypothetical protein HFJ95_08075 [Muribaculaceae bacterium]|nr:hypothetical protein [Muribaculaceae bacterium]
MCRIIYRDANGNIAQKPLNGKVRHITELGVYQSGITRSERISFRMMRSTFTRPFKWE